MSEDDRPGKIRPPKRNLKADVTRSATRGLVGSIPLAGAILSEASDYIGPNPTATDRERWENEVTDGVNLTQEQLADIGSAFRPARFTLAGAAAFAAHYLTTHCPNGLANEIVTFETIASEGGEFSTEQLEEGLDELESLGLIEALRAIGRHSYYRMTEYGYEVLDPPIMGWTPQEDAKELAKLILQTSDGISVRDLHQQTGWERRRFNPALRVILTFVDPRRVSDEMQNQYVTTTFFMIGAERASLRRFSA